MATTIVTLTSGSYSYENGTIKSNGSLNINQDKLIMYINGPVTDNNAQIGSFSANRDMPESQGNLRYNISFDDPTKAMTLLQAVQDVVAAVQNELTPAE